MDDAQLRSIVNSAAWPEERRSPQFVPLPDSPDHRARRAQRRSEWCARTANDDPALLERLFDWDALDPPSVERSLSDVTLVDEHMLPAWAFRLQSVMQMSTNQTIVADRALSSSAPAPFEHALLPFVRCAREEVGRRVAPSALAMFTEQAQADLERQLLAQLCDLASSTLHAEFGAFRATRPVLLALSLESAGPSRQRYQEFIQSQAGGGLADTFARYPVLARLLAVRLGTWCDNTVLLMDRLAADRGPLAHVLGLAGHESISRVHAGLSDPHRGGHSVSVLVANDGTAVVYKPRSLQPEAAFNGVLRWLATTGFEIELHEAKLCMRDGYGWMVYIETRPCENARDAEHFVERAGALLGLTYLLGASDLHSGNVIAHGSHPVLVDLEVLAAPLVRSHEGAKADGGAHVWRSWNSVLRTGLLPARGPASNGRSYLEGGLAGAHAGHPTRLRGWRHINTDAMTPTSTDVISRSLGGPMLRGRPVDIARHRSVLARGLRYVLEHVVAHREALLRDGGPLDALSNVVSRAVLRDTRIYASVLARSIHPRFLRSGVTWSTELDVLRAPELTSLQRPHFWAARRTEQRELRRLDIPLFTIAAASRRLVAGMPEQGRDSAGEQPHAEVEDVTDHAGIHDVYTRIRALDADEIERQLQMVRVALTPGATCRARSVRETAPSAFTRSLAHSEARAIAARLARLSVDDLTGGSTWVGFVERPGSTRAELGDIGFDLFGGRVGIALFLAAVARTTGDNASARLARRALGPLADGAAKPRQAIALVEQMGLGAGTGLGGVIYGLARIASLLKDPSLTRAAWMLARTITPARIETDGTFDVLGGSAGAILGLLALRPEAPDSLLRRQVDFATSHLLGARSTDASSGQRAWRGNGGRLHTGFAHGAAGIALALRRADDALGAADARLASAEAEAFIDAHDWPAGDSWRETSDYANAPSARPWCSWCRGAAGIGLARLQRGAHDGMRSTAVAQAARRTSLSVHPSVDHLCCGTLGRVEFLFTAGLVARDRALQ